MTWLPELRAGEHRGWLPCSSKAALGLADLAVRRSAGDSIGARRIASDLCAEDPPFLIWAVSQWGLDTGTHQIGAHQHGARQRVSVAWSDLIDWLLDEGLHHFSAGCNNLGAPEPVGGLREAFAQLWFETRKTKISKWLQSAARWFAVVGSSSTDGFARCPKLVELDGVTEPSQLDEPFVWSQMPIAQLYQQLAEREKLSGQFSAAVAEAKRAALYQWAYGLSHEINNPLANISARAQSLLAKAKTPEQTKPLQAIVGQATRAYEMIADMMYIARPPAPVVARVDVSALVQRVVAEFDDVASSRDLQMQVIAPEYAVEATIDAAMIGEACRAVVRNAVEAVDDGGEIVVRCEATSEQIRVLVMDNGPGFSQLAQQHALDLFFSGRDAGRGLGVGLSKAMRILEQHRGTIEINRSVPGAIVTLVIPR